MCIVTRHHCEVLQLDGSVVKLGTAVGYCEPQAAAVGVGCHEVMPSSGRAKRVSCPYERREGIM
jgi:hypothetical protein